MEKNKKISNFKINWDNAIPREKAIEVFTKGEFMCVIAENPMVEIAAHKLDGKYYLSLNGSTKAVIETTEEFISSARPKVQEQ